MRIPGLARADAIEEYAKARGIQVWSADFPADDWRHVPASRVYDLAIQRLEAKGKGILLLHDIQPRTVAALPRILQELKARGYRIVHVVPATAERPATPTEPQQWLLHPPTETVAISRWPKIPRFVFAETNMLPAPDIADLDRRDNALFDRARRVRGIPPPSPLAQASSATSLPIPAASVFRLPEGARVTRLAATSRVNCPGRAAPTPRGAEHFASAVSAKSPTATAHPRRVAHQAPHAGLAPHIAPKRAEGKKNGRAVRLASLKKRPSGPKVETAAPTAD